MGKIRKKKETSSNKRSTQRKRKREDRIEERSWETKSRQREIR